MQFEIQDLSMRRPSRFGGGAYETDFVVIAMREFDVLDGGRSGSSGCLFFDPVVGVESELSEISEQ